MEKGFNTNTFLSEREGNGSPDQNDAGSPPSTTFCDMKMASSPPLKRSRRSIQKRVVSVPIRDVEGSRLKGDTAPPSDSWAWRKYGQKPIKGSPYPRGYYRCSSSKGCPARKQVERSREDPTMLLITYSCEHNHPWPSASRTSNKSQPKPEPEPELQPEPEPEPEAEPAPEPEFACLGGGGDEFAWFGDMETTSSTILESPLFSGTGRVGDPDPTSAAAAAAADVAFYLPMREEDESLFADLGELPDCSLVFRHRNVGPQVGIC